MASTITNGGLMSRALKYSVRGGALYYAIFVMLILSMFGVLLLGYFQIKFKEDYLLSKKSELNDNLRSAITLLGAKPSTVPIGQTREIDLFSDSTAMVDLMVDRWGMLRKVTATAQWRNQVMKQIALMGEKERKRPALWMPDNKSFVSLVGNSYIKGDCYLPRQGIRKGNAEGRYFEGPFLHKGALLQSNERLPLLKENLIHYLNEYLSGVKSDRDSLVLWNEIKNQKEVSHPFSLKTMFVQAKGNLELEKGSFSDNIVFYSSDTIKVWPSVDLQDVLLLGRVIVFKGGYKGQLQAFARERISVEQACKFEYPSFLGCFVKGTGFIIKISQERVIKGCVLAYSGSSEESDVLLWLKERSKIFGKAYVYGDCRFQGDIIGSLYCNRFVLKTSRAFYENFIIDCSIDEAALPDEYVSFCLDDIHKLKMIRECL